MPLQPPYLRVPRWPIGLAGMLAVLVWTTVITQQSWVERPAGWWGVGVWVGILACAVRWPSPRRPAFWGMVAWAGVGAAAIHLLVELPGIWR